MSRSTRLLFVAWMSSLVVAACTSGTGTPDPATVLDVFTPYRGAEATAFQEVLADFSARTDIETRHVGTADFAMRMRERVLDGDLPAVALFPQASILEELAADGQLVLLDDLLSDVADRTLPGLEGVGVVDGRRVGVGFRLAVKSLLWYPPAEFSEAGYTPPTTWRELLDLTSQIESMDITPWCLGMEAFGETGWVGTDWIEDLVLRMHGPQLYDTWAAGEIAFTSRPIAAAFEQFGRIALTERLVLGGTRAVLATPVEDALLPMLEDPPRCLLARQPSFVENALPEGIVIGQRGALAVQPLPPVAEGPAPLVVSGEWAGAFDDSDEADALMRYLADPAAGEVWARQGGFVSPHADFDTSAYGEAFDRQIAGIVANAPVLRYDASDQMPADVGRGTFYQGMVDYVAGSPLDSVLEEIQRGYGAAGTPGGS